MHPVRLFFTALLLVPLLARPAIAQLLDPSFQPPTGLYAPATVYTLGPQQADGKRLVSGNFTRVNGTAVSRLVRLDASGALDLPFLQNVGNASLAYRVCSLPTGQYLLCGFGGPFTAGGLVRTEMLRLNANGTADASFDIGIGPELSGSESYGNSYAVQPDGKIVVVGYFDAFNGVPAAGAVRLNPNGSIDPSFAVGTGFDVNSGFAPNTVVVQPDGKILMGGYFDTFNGQTASGLLRLNANGTVDASFTPPLQANTDIEGLVMQPDGKLLIYGYLQPAGSSPTGLLRLLPSGNVDPSFTPAAFLSAGRVTARYFGEAVQLQPDGKILVIGSFSAPTAPNRVARLNADGSLDASFQVGAGPGSAPFTLGLQANGSVLVGGSWNTFAGVEKTLVILSSTGSLNPTSPTIQTPGTVTKLLRQADGKLVLGGNFTELNGLPVHRLARLNDNGTVDAAYTAALGMRPDPVLCLALQADGKVLAGSGVGISRFNTNGSPDLSFNSTQPTTVMALQADGKLLVGHSSSASIMRLTSTGSWDPSFVINTTGASLGTPSSTDAILVQPDGRVVTTGRFYLSGQPFNMSRVVRYETTGTLDASFNNSSAYSATSGFSSSLVSLSQQADGKLLVGGGFNSVDGTTQPGVVRLSTSGLLDPGFTPNFSLTGTVYSIVPQPNGRILLGGLFTSSAATGAMANLARLLDNGQADPSFGPSTTPNATVQSVLVQPDGNIVFAGGFSTVDSQPAMGLARIGAINVLHVAAPAAVAARTAAWPVPAHSQLHVAPDISAQPRSVELLDALGRQLRYQAVSTAAELSLNVEQLPAGVYMLRVNYASGAVTRRISVE
jgi:uncharacterized delta-60 repeat protein